MKQEVYNIKGENLGREVELSDDVFGLELNDKHEHVVYLAVKQYNAHQRQGTHKSKERAEITGSTRKLKRQKGTGTARAGSIKSPVFRGGGRVFGPRPRTYSIKLNKKVKRLARRAVLSSKAQEGKIIVVEDFKFDAPKTKSYANLLASLKVDAGKSLLMLNVPNAPVVPAAPKAPGKPRGAKKKATYKSDVAAYRAAVKQYGAEVAAYNSALDAHDEELEGAYVNIVLSGRNLAGTSVVNAKEFNVYQVMNADYLILSESAVAQLQAALG